MTLQKSHDGGLFREQIDLPDLGYALDASAKRQFLRRLIEENPEVVRTWNAFGGDQWVGGLLWLQDHRRITYLYPVTTRKGRELDAATFLLYSLIQEHQGTQLLLDLEGSMIPGVARFYRSFGAQPEPYYFIQSRLYGLF